MKKVSFPLIAVVLCCMVLFSCKKDDPAECSDAWATELENELTAITDAFTVYYTDPSDANCDALKDAYQDYIDALRPYGNCATLTGQARTDWQNALDDAEDSIDTLC